MSLPTSRALLDDYGFGDARELVEAKLRGERTALDEAMRNRWLRELGRAFDVLDDAERTSPLPIEPANLDELDAWLVQTRRAVF